jgi:Caulimovirus viroplasmin
MPDYYYAVAKGRQTGVYVEWDEASKAVSGFSNAVHKKFKSLDAAMKFAGSYGTKAILRYFYSGPNIDHPYCKDPPKSRKTEDDEEDDINDLARAISRVLVSTRKARR